MAERALSPRTYVVVCVVLVLFTVLTVAASFFKLGPLWHGVVGLAIAVCKGSLVLLFFMHVLVSKRLTWIVIAVTAFWLLALLFGLTFNDYLTRGLVPFTPGH